MIDKKTLKQLREKQQTTYGKPSAYFADEGLSLDEFIDWANEFEDWSPYLNQFPTIQVINGVFVDGIAFGYYIRDHRDLWLPPTTIN